jgi:hypothetical protein
MNAKHIRILAFAAMSVAVVGCRETPGLLRNQDPVLRQPKTVLRADAARRTYPSEAARVQGLAARSQIGYMAKTVEVANLSDADWDSVEVWVNKQYVVFLPKIEARALRAIPFDAMYDQSGQHLPTESRTFVVETVEVFMGGKLYDIKVTVSM